MALKDNMSLDEIEKFLLKGDMQDVLKWDVEPILHLNREEGGYFGVPRQLFSLIDFLGSTYTGKHKPGNSSRGAVKYIHEVMGSDEIDPNYKKNGKLMYDMYRHGIVHFFQPKKFELFDGTKVAWCVHKKGRNDTVDGIKDHDGKEYVIENARHLEIMRHPDPKKDFSVLIISLKCLFEDFKKSLNVYFEIAKKDDKYVTKWNAVAAYMTTYEKYPRKKESFFSKLMGIIMNFKL